LYDKTERIEETFKMLAEAEHRVLLSAQLNIRAEEDALNEKEKVLAIDSGNCCQRYHPPAKS
jgi:hypothetical protein